MSNTKRLKQKNKNSPSIEGFFYEETHQNQNLKSYLTFFNGLFVNFQIGIVFDLLFLKF